MEAWGPGPFAHGPPRTLTVALTEVSLDHFTGEDSSGACFLRHSSCRKMAAEQDGLPAGTGRRQPGLLLIPRRGTEGPLRGRPERRQKCLWRLAHGVSSWREGEGFFCLWRGCPESDQEATCLHPEAPFLGPNPTVTLRLTGETSGRQAAGARSSRSEGEGSTLLGTGHGTGHSEQWGQGARPRARGPRPSRKLGCVQNAHPRPSPAPGWFLEAAGHQEAAAVFQWWGGGRAVILYF